MNKKITVITGSRAEWGILRPLCYELKKLSADLSVIITGSHLKKLYQENAGENYNEFSNDFDFKEVCITPENTSSDSEILMFGEMANVFEKLPHVLKNLKPDLAIILGDRYEIFAVASVCRLMGISLVHFSGGELTLGAFDDALRHCVTKLSDFHFVSNYEHKKRVVQLGEAPEKVYETGDLALAGFKELRFKDAKNLEKLFNCPFEDFFLLTVHPETCTKNKALEITKILLTDLRKEYPHTYLIFTGANTDPGGEEINNAIIESAQKDSQIIFIQSMGRINYLSAAKLAKCVIGNSSSAVVEIPALKTPAVNIGNRQKGRKSVNSVFDCDANFPAIKNAVAAALKYKFDDDSRITDTSDPAKLAAEIIFKLDKMQFGREKPFFDVMFKLN